MKLEIKNIWYILAWVLIAAFIFNPTFASQISSNLVKWFVAITSSDTKTENNLVWLDAWWKLPTDVIPAEAATTAWTNLYICTTNIDTANNTSFTCPTGYSKMSFIWKANRHEMMVTTPSWSNKTWFNNDWHDTWKSYTNCCVQD